MAKNPEKKKSPFRHLWAILIALGADIILFVAACILDSETAPVGAGEGHPAPVWMISALLVLGFATIVFIIVALIRFFVELGKRSREKRFNEVASDKTSPDYTADPLEKPGKKPMTKWKVFRPLILLPIKYALDYVLLIWSASKAEPLPEGVIGFPISGALILASVFVILTSIILLVVVIILVVTRWKRLKRERAEQTL